MVIGCGGYSLCVRDWWGLKEDWGGNPWETVGLSPDWCDCVTIYVLEGSIGRIGWGVGGEWEWWWRVGREVGEVGWECVGNGRMV